MIPPCPAPFNMACYALRQAAPRTDHVAVEVLGEPGARLSFGAVERAVLGLAAGLLDHGLRSGDRVLLRLGNTLDFPLTFLACLAVDLVPVATSSQLTQAEITPMARRISPRLVIADPEVALPDLDDVLIIMADALVALRKTPPAAYAMGAPDRPGYVVFTSGTDAQPRAVLHAHRAIWARQSMIDAWEGLRAEDRLLHAGALNWTYTMGTGLLDPWFVGATALIPAAGTPPAALPDMLARARATIFAAAPGVFRQMLRAGLPPLPRLRHALSAGEKLPHGLRTAWRDATGTDIHEAYGLSECSTLISGGPAHPAPEGMLGRAQTGREICVLGAEGPVLDQPGALAIRADDPGVMLGYLDDVKTTAEKHRDGWFLTGDVAQIRADGWVQYLGRDDDVITAGGFRVSPVEIEEVALAFPGLTEATAHEHAVGQDVRVIALSYCADAPIDEDALAAHCADRLARYKCPRVFLPRASLPRGGNGKLRRKALRDMAE